MSFWKVLQVLGSVKSGAEEEASRVTPERRLEVQMLSTESVQLVGLVDEFQAEVAAYYPPGADTGGGAPSWFLGEGRKS